MDVNEVIDKARDSFNVRRVFGEPIQQGEVTLVPAAWVIGGGGGGGGEGAANNEGAKAAEDSAKGFGSGFGSGFGLHARPAGAFILRNGKVQWMPAVDVNRIVLGAQVLVGLFLLTIGKPLMRHLLKENKRFGHRRFAW